MTTQPEALRLAKRLQDFALALPAYGFDDRPLKDAAAELRRLHAEVEALRAAQGEQKPAAWLHKNRLGGVQAFTTEPPPGLKAQCQPLYASPVAPTAQEPVGARYRRIGRHVAEIAKRLGRPDDSAEGELEYIQRLSYSQGLEDASPVATQGEQPMVNMTPPATARDRWMYEQGRLAEREIICAAIKAEDDHCVTKGDYMLDSDDCIKVARGQWVRPVYEDAALSATTPPVATTKDDEA